MSLSFHVLFILDRYARLDILVTKTRTTKLTVAQLTRMLTLSADPKRGAFAFGI